MKKIIIAFLLAAVIFSCQKKEQNVTPQEQDVVFGIVQVDPSQGLKSTADVPDCNGLEPDYAVVDILDVVANTTETYTPTVFRLGDQLYTQAIKLDAGDYKVTKFILYHSDTPDDVIVMATPDLNATFDEYVRFPLPYDITVNAFEKLNVDIDVLCFEEDAYLDFGFNWFTVEEIVIREFCFFGDFCMKHPVDYTGSDYTNQAGWPGDVPFHDAPAIIKVHAYKGDAIPANELPYSPFTNATAEANYGVGAPLCVQYPDNINVDNEEYTFELYILVKSGTDFVYEHFLTFSSKDHGPLMDLDDNPVPDVDGDLVTEFVLGSCNYSDTDVQLPPYMNLPATCTYKITGFNPNGNPSATPPLPPSYVVAILGGFGAGYDIFTGPNACYCVDFANQISMGTTYNMNVYSSLYLPLVPAYIADAYQWDKINWIINNLDMFPNYQWYDIQAATWMLATPVTWNGNAYPANGFNYTWANLPIAQAMVAAANTIGTGFTPLPGGWACVIFASPDGQSIQTMFTLIDP